MSLNRIVVLLTPLVFAPAAGWLSVFAAKHGITMPKDKALASEIEGVTFVLGALIAYAKAHHWLRGWQKYEQDVAPFLADLTSDKHGA